MYKPYKTLSVQTGDTVIQFPSAIISILTKSQPIQLIESTTIEVRSSSSLENLRVE